MQEYTVGICGLRSPASSPGTDTVVRTIYSIQYTVYTYGHFYKKIRHIQFLEVFQNLAKIKTQIWHTLSFWRCPHEYLLFSQRETKKYGEKQLQNFARVQFLWDWYWCQDWRNCCRDSLSEISNFLKGN